MAGYTDAVFRSLCRRYKSALSFTEVVSSTGIARKIPQSMHYLETFPGESPTAAHMYGSEPEIMAEAAQVAESLGRFSLIDINCGCPVRKVQHKGAGVALMRHPQKICDIVRAVTAAVKLPVTVKTRLGLSKDLTNIQEVAHAIEEGGAKALFLHARVAANRHSGPAAWEELKKIKDQLHIPVVGNGGIQKPEDAMAMIAATGVDGVMIGRAAIGNPWIFTAIYNLFHGEKYTPPTDKERYALIAEHLTKLQELVHREDEYRRHRRLDAERTACRHFRAHLVKYISGYHGMRELLRQLNQLDTQETLLAAVRELLKVEIAV